MAKLTNGKFHNHAGQRIVHRMRRLPGVREIHVRAKRLVKA